MKENKQHIEGDKNIQVGRDFIQKINTKYIVLILIIIAITILFSVLRNDISLMQENLKAFDKSDYKSMNILLLPFKPDKDCKEVVVDYKGQLVERLKESKEKENLEYNILSLDRVECPESSGEAQKMGEKKNADLVIWGSFEENKSDETIENVRIRYVLTNTFELDSTMNIGDSEIQRINSLRQLREGYLQDDIDFIIYWLEGMYEYKNGSYNVALERFKKIIEDSTRIKTPEAYFSIADVMSELGKIEKAIEYELKGLEILRELHITDSLLWAESYNSLGSHYGELGKDMDKAIFYNKKAIKMADSLNLENSSITANFHSSLAVKYHQIGEYRNSIIEEKKGIDKRDNSNQNICELEYTTPYITMAINYESLEKLDSSIYYNLKAIDILDRNLSEFHPKKALVYNNLSLTYRDLDEYEKALAAIDLALKIREKNLSKNHYYFIASYSNKALILNEMEKYLEALIYYDKSEDVLNNNFDFEKFEHAGIHNNKATSYFGLNDIDNAEKHYLEAVAIVRRVTKGKMHPNIGITYRSLAKVYRKKRNLSEALKFHEKSIKVAKQKVGLPLANFITELAITHREFGEVDLAKKSLESAEIVCKSERGCSQKTRDLISKEFKSLKTEK